MQNTTVFVVNGKISGLLPKEILPQRMCLIAFHQTQTPLPKFLTRHIHGVITFHVNGDDTMCVIVHINNTGDGTVAVEFNDSQYFTSKEYEQLLDMSSRSYKTNGTKVLNIHGRKYRMDATINQSRPIKVQVDIREQEKGIAKYICPKALYFMFCIRL